MNMDNLDQALLDPNLQQLEPPKQRGWWSRNWLWFLPTLLLSCVLLCCGCPAGIGLWFLNQAFKLEVYQTAMQKIKTDETLRQELGEPIETLHWPPPAFRVEQHDHRGEADMRWEIAGPKGHARAHLTARLADEDWDIVVLEVELANHKKVSLSVEGNEAPIYQPPKPDDQKPDDNAPPPEINLPMPDVQAPAEKK